MGDLAEVFLDVSELSQPVRSSIRVERLTAGGAM
jgi:hypothetical protein